MAGGTRADRLRSPSFEHEGLGEVEMTAFGLRLSNNEARLGREGDAESELKTGVQIVLHEGQFLFDRSHCVDMIQH
jgi:hypothetical protein